MCGTTIDGRDNRRDRIVGRFIDGDTFVFIQCDDDDYIDRAIRRRGPRNRLVRRTQRRFRAARVRGDIFRGRSRTIPSVRPSVFAAGFFLFRFGFCARAAPAVVRLVRFDRPIITIIMMIQDDGRRINNITRIRIKLCVWIVSYLLNKTKNPSNVTRRVRITAVTKTYKLL